MSIQIKNLAVFFVCGLLLIAYDRVVGADKAELKFPDLDSLRRCRSARKPEQKTVEAVVKEIELTRRWRRRVA